MGLAHKRLHDKVGVVKCFIDMLLQYPVQDWSIGCIDISSVVFSPLVHVRLSSYGPVTVWT